METAIITPAQAMKLARRFKAACEREDSDLGVRLWVADAAADMMLCAGGQPPAWLTKVADEYEVVWPGGEIYKNRHDQTRLTETEARMTAPRIGGTWRRAATEDA